MGFACDESGEDGVECFRKESGRKFVNIIRSIVNGSGLTSVCRDTAYRSYSFLFFNVWKRDCGMGEKERARIKAVEMHKLRGLLGIRIIEILPKVWVGKLRGVKKGVGMK